MGDSSKIEWTEATWNPVTGCVEVSPGCDNCYAKTFAERWRGVPGHAYEHGFDLTLRPERIDQPLRWARARRIFVNSMSDLFHDGIPDEYIARVFQSMGTAPHHTYQILTKRHGRMRSWVTRWYDGAIPEPFDERPVPDYPGYTVDTLGVVRGKRADTRSGLAYDIGEQGHKRVTMHREGSPQSGDREFVHRLVLSAFVRRPRPGEQARHLNGDPTDNRLSNLRWGTQEDNWRDRREHGARQSYTKLTENEVATIRLCSSGGESAYAIAQRYGVSDTQIRNIVSGRQWSGPVGERPSGYPRRALLDCVWLGVSVEDQKWETIRSDALRETPAAVRFYSAEPLLGPIRADLDGIDWVIVGGESGPHSRPMHPDWARQIRDECVAAGVAFHFKQWGEWAPATRDRATHLLNVSGALVTVKAATSEQSYGSGPPTEQDFIDRGHPGWVRVRKVGKKFAGRELDGRTWDEWPVER